MSIDSPKKPTEEVASYPFLDDTRTVEWIKKNAVMVVMRGLPGSGKSFLVDKICSRFGTQSEPVAVHSADHYFIDSQGGYQFDRSRCVPNQTHQSRICYQIDKEASIK